MIQIARDLGYELIERDIARAELALADEVFLTGTAAELTPVREIDDIEIGPPGPDHAPDPAASSTTPCTAAARAVRGVARPGAGTIQGVNASSCELR